MSWLMWLLLVVLVIAAIIAKIRRSARIIVFRSENMQSPPSHGGGDRQVHGLRNSNVEQMVSCATCGIYVPASEAIFRTGKVYCCEEHTPS
ncbi:MAG: hypothetical protein LBM56_03380 [Burkholderiaceae bacterium]|nr:hypothetical protein [Burkholderiaceae bacterium]